MVTGSKALIGRFASSTNASAPVEAWAPRIIAWLCNGLANWSRRCGNRVGPARQDCPAGGLHVFDLSTPANPRKVGSFSLLKSIQNVVVSGNCACATGFDTNNNQGIYIIDCSDPTNLRQAGFYPARASMVTISGRDAYLMDQIQSDNQSLDVLDLSDPAHPKLVGSNPLFTGDNIYANGNNLYVTGTWQFQDSVRSRALVVLDLFKPLALTAAPRYAHQAMGLAVQGLAGLPVGIERSADLATWQSWTNLTLGSAPVELQDPAAPESPRQFYRAVAR